MVKQRVNRIPIGMIAAVGAAAIAAGGGAAWWTFNSAKISRPPQPSTQATNVPSPVQTPAEATAEVYWLKDTGESVELVPQPIKVAAIQPTAVIESAFDNLLAGPQDKSVASTIPQGTKLRSVNVQDNGIHIDLSQEFTVGGGSASMSSRVAQVLYTATSLQPNAKVWIEVEGKPLEILGGEGLELEQPLTREYFKENFTL